MATAATLPKLGDILALPLRLTEDGDMLDANGNRPDAENDTERHRLMAEGALRAINCHDDLLAALSNLIELIEAQAPQAARGPDVEAARAAIARAER